MDKRHIVEDVALFVSHAEAPVYFGGALKQVGGALGLGIYVVDAEEGVEVVGCQLFESVGARFCYGFIVEFGGTVVDSQ